MLIVTQRRATSYVEELRELGYPQNLIVLSKATILFVAKEAVSQGSTDGREVSGQPDVERIGICFLMANDLMLGYEPKRSDTLLQNVAGLLPFGDLLPWETAVEDIARNRIIFDVILDEDRIRRNRTYKDLRQVFEDRCRISYMRYCGLVFASACYFMRPLGEAELRADQSYLPAKFFSQTGAKGDEVAAFFSLTAADFHEIRVELSGARQLTDFGAMQRFPLLRHADGACLCLDPGFLLDKAGRGLYWTLRSQMDEQEGKWLKDFWGLICEGYLHWIWKHNYLGSGVYHPSPSFADGAEAFDAYLLEGDTLTVFEYKSSMLTATSKHSFSGPEFGKDLEGKYACFNANPKGVGQIERSLQRWLDGGEIAGLDRRRIHKVISVLVSFDDALIGVGVARYLDSLFYPYRRRLSKRTKKTFPPLFTLYVPNLEYVLPFTLHIPFHAMLESFARKEPSRSRPLQNAIGTELNKMGRGKDVIREHFEQSFTKWQEMLFPDPDGPK